MPLATDRRPIGRTGLEVTVLGLGGAPLGEDPRRRGAAVADMAR